MEFMHVQIHSKCRIRTWLQNTLRFSLITVQIQPLQISASNSCSSEICLKNQFCLSIASKSYHFTTRQILNANCLIICYMLNHFGGYFNLPEQLKGKLYFLLMCLLAIEVLSDHGKSMQE